MSKEDKLVNQLIKRAGNASFVDEVEVEAEAHYSHYGTRGVADLYVREIDIENGREYLSDSLYEVKSGSAVRQATGANEIIRQYNKMRKTFYLDESRDEPDDLHIELAFTIEPATVRHVAENFSLYASVDSNTLFVDSSNDDLSDESVFFRSLDEEFSQPVQLLNGDFDRATSVEGWKNYLEMMSEGGQEPARQVLDCLEK